jgi:hypothetical protein
MFFPEVDGPFDGGVDDDCRLGGRLDLFGVAGRLDLFGVAGLWIEMARGREV